VTHGQRREAEGVALAIIAGVGAFLVLGGASGCEVASAAEVEPEAFEFAFPSLEDILARGAAASAVVVAALLFARAFVPWLTRGTEPARLANLALAVVVGCLTGAVGLAPQLAEGLAGQLLGGFLCGGMATFGRDALTRSWRTVEEQLP
jgi:hypothetical protein